MYFDLNIIIIILATIFSPIFYAIKYKREVSKLQKQLNDYNENIKKIIEYKTKQYRIKTEQAIESNKYKSDYISNMATELNTTVNCILDFSFIGKNNIGIWSDDKHKRNYELLMNNTAKIRNHLNKLFDISRLEAGRVHFHFTSKTIAEVIGQSVLELQELSKSRENSINIIEPDDFTKATFDFNSMIKVTTSFLKYIIDNSAYGSTINISIGDTVIINNDLISEAVFCSISCNNFSDTEKADLFSQYNCKNMDLNICKETIKTHNGKIWVDNSDNIYKISYSIPCVREEIRELDKAA